MTKPIFITAPGKKGVNPSKSVFATDPFIIINSHRLPNRNIVRVPATSATINRPRSFESPKISPTTFGATRNPARNPPVAPDNNAIPDVIPANIGSPTTPADTYKI